MTSDAQRLATQQVRMTLASTPESTLKRIQPGESFGSRWWLLLGALVAVLAVGVVAAFVGFHGPVTLLAVAFGSLTLVGIAAYWVYKELLAPMRQMRHWAANMCSGDLTTRLSSSSGTEFARLAFHVNRLSHALDRLANDMDLMVEQQTARLEQQNRTIAILYDIARAPNEAGDVDGVLRAAAHEMAGLVNARGAILLEPLELVETDGITLRARVLDGFLNVPEPVLGPLMEYQHLKHEVQMGTAMQLGYDQDCEGVVYVIRTPLEYRGHLDGALDLMVDVLPPETSRQELKTLFASVGRHLGVALEKARLEAQSQRLQLVRERNEFAHELHDSLAQTIAGLHMRVDMLEDTLAADHLSSDAIRSAKGDVSHISAAVDDAHTELRELIANFRAPVDERGISTALRELTERAKAQASGCAVTIQIEGEEPALPGFSHLQLVRIVGEALTNARKHSKAKNLRVLVNYESDKGVRVLVEDDGIGMAEQVVEGGPGEHLGMSIMRERAQRAGGEFYIESEPDEGTRLEVFLPLKPDYE